MSTRETLLAEIDKFIAETGMSATRFGEKAIKDRALVTRLRDGRDLRSATIDRIRAFMANERKRRERPSRSAPRALAVA